MQLGAAVWVVEVFERLPCLDPAVAAMAVVGYRGGGYGGGYRGGGMGFPFLIPIFGFGGGGLFGLLILMAVAGVLVNAVRGGISGGGAPGMGGAPAAPALPRNVNMIQLQVGLLASAKSVQDDLRRLAASSDTASKSGLQRLAPRNNPCASAPARSLGLRQF
jgi:uncharacterized membrane protein